ncbi:MAG: hypothetical protein ACE5LD_00745, partial [Candidatus Bipolaricaulia bacterium]
MRRIKIKAMTIGLAVASLLVGSALALTGDEVLQRSEEAMRPGQDMTAEERMTVTAPDGSEEVMET